MPIDTQPTEFTNWIYTDCLYSVSTQGFVSLFWKGSAMFKGLENSSNEPAPNFVWILANLLFILPKSISAIVAIVFRQLKAYRQFITARILRVQGLKHFHSNTLENEIKSAKRIKVLWEVKLTREQKVKSVLMRFAFFWFRCVVLSIVVMASFVLSAVPQAPTLHHRLNQQREITFHVLFQERTQQ